jgi:hypothetical protein
MENGTQTEVRRLQTGWPAWMIWVVPTVVGPDTWCAKRWDDEGTSTVINAKSPEQLEAALKAAT